MARKPKAREPSSSPEASGDEDLAATDPPSSIDPYAVLSIEKSATSDQIKSAYRRAALKSHPDKATPENKDAAHQKFQEVAFAYAILSDEKRRKRYDTTGNTQESLEDDSDFDWVDFFREQMSVMVDGAMIDKVKKEYQGSEEEKEDILKVYTDSQGDMDAVYEEIMCSNVLDDDDRFRAIIDYAIQQNLVRHFPRYAKESKQSRKERVQKAKGEEREAMELAEELGVKDKLFGKNGAGQKGSKAKKGGGDEDSLMALIQQRQKDRASGFLERMEEKYGGGGEGRPKKGKRKVEEPSEEAFAKNAKKAKAKGR